MNISGSGDKVGHQTGFELEVVAPIVWVSQLLPKYCCSLIRFGVFGLLLSSSVVSPGVLSLI